MKISILFTFAIFLSFSNNAQAQFKSVEESKVIVQQEIDNNLTKNGRLDLKIQGVDNDVMKLEGHLYFFDAFMYAFGVKLLAELNQQNDVQKALDETKSHVLPGTDEASLYISQKGYILFEKLLKL